MTFLLITKLMKELMTNEKLIEKNIQKYYEQKPFGNNDTTFTDLSTKSNSSLGHQKFIKKKRFGSNKKSYLNSIIEENPGTR